MSGTYLDKLHESYRKSGSLVCMGLDPVIEYLPIQTGSVRNDLNEFYHTLLFEMKLQHISPGAFKPNIGYFSALDRPRDDDYSGSQALADLLDLIEELFPGIPVILDAKRGDIARSSLNYAIEAFDAWKSDAVTVSPYMGTDSVTPFMVEGKGIYILNRTSNPGGRDLQNLQVEGEDLYRAVAGRIVTWSVDHPGLGAVVGATSPDELEDVARIYVAAEASIPLLIPGVGSQGGSAAEVTARLRTVSYDLDLVRINSSSGITHPWKDGSIPSDWKDIVVGNLRRLNDEIGL